MKSSQPALRAFLSVAALLMSGCGPATSTAAVPATAIPFHPVGLPTQTAAPTAGPLPQPTATEARFGPDQDNFPAGINPLTGQPVIDASLLKIPAVLVSISHFPPTARPQAGLSFAPYVFEFSITTGESRFLAAFYGGFPAPEVPVTGDCEVRSGAFGQTASLLGNQVWLDANKNGIQEFGEKGIGGVCVDLFAADGTLLQQTTTDSNGYYGFNIEPGQGYTVGFIKPAGLDFTRQDVGDEDHDSDADPSSGKTASVRADGDDLLLDAGLVPDDSNPAPASVSQTEPKPQVGPVRSGRLLYAYIAGFFQDSCLIYAFASEEVLEKIPHCAFVAHEISGGGAMLEIERMKAVADDNMRRTADKPFNYYSNAFSDQPPAGGLPASQINVFFASLNQSGWTYDPLYRAWLRYVDTADKDQRGVLHPEIDRLTGRQLHFENVVVVMADTEVVSPTNLDIKLDQGEYGYAFLFRDGRMYPIRWSTRSGEYEKKSGFRRPIRFLNPDGSPALLKPGHTWILVVTPFSLVQEQTTGVYLVRYAAPAGENR
jgi:SdrD B-like protein/DUF3048 family protein